MALINCPECGAQVSDKAPACPKCGTPINPQAQQSNPQQSGSQQVFNNFISAPQKEVTPDQAVYLSKWNWGAFLFGTLWPFFNGLVPVGIVTVLLALISNTHSSLSSVATIALCGIWIWLGMKGSKIAWNRKEWDSFDTFVETQKKWVKWGILLFSIQILLVIIGVAMALSY